MIGPQYLALINDQNPDDDTHLHDIEARTRLHVAYRSDNLTVLIGDEGESQRLGEQDGILLGSLFSGCEGYAAVTNLLPGACAAIRGTRGQHLIDHYWGSYVTILESPEERTVDVIRSPNIDIPCYFIDIPNGLIVTSDMDILLKAGLLQPEIDRSFLVDYLFLCSPRRETTGLKGVKELVPGARLKKRRGSAAFMETLWSPWQFCGGDMRLSDAQEARAMLRMAVHGVVRALKPRDKPVLLGVSGGLDSSILAVCLADIGCPFELMTLAAEDPAGDERPYARALAQSLGVRLHERFETLEAIDIVSSAAGHLPRPLARSFAQSSDYHYAALAAETGATEIWSGGGGDNVFCSLQSTVPVADRLLTGGLNFAAIKTAGDMGQLTGSSLFRVLRKSIHRAWCRPAGYTWHIDTRFLTLEVVAGRAGAPAHAWLEVPSDGLPGKAAHIALILGIQNYLEGFGAERQLPRRFPLLSQPVVETCLRIPSWCWCEDGINRSVARAAFADLLPRVIRERSGKGTPSGFVMQVFKHNLKLIRDMLREGYLVRSGIVDWASVNKALLRQGPVQGLDYSRILSFVDVEAWVAAWCAKGVTKSSNSPGTVIR